MIAFRIAGIIAALGLTAAMAIGTRTAMQRKNQQAEQAEGSGSLLPYTPPTSSTAVTATRERYLSSLEATKKEQTPLASLWAEFEKSLRAIHPDTPAIRSEADAAEALQKASAWLDTREKQMADASSSAVVQAADQINQEIGKRKADLQELRKLAALPYREMLSQLLVLGSNRRTPQGIELIWIDDAAGHPKSGGFWAAKKEISTELWGKVTDEAPAGRWSPPRVATTADFMDEARTRFVSSLQGPQKIAYDSANAQDKQRMLAFHSGRISQIAAGLQKAANTNQMDYSRFPAQFVNLPAKTGTEPFLQKLSADNPPGSSWTYRLPTSAEWSAMNGRVDGIGAPDVSEWLADKPVAVDKNWKSNQATDPPEPGTVGFRVVFAETP